MQFDDFLNPRAANFQPLTPLSFLDHALLAFSDRPAVAWHDRIWNYAEFHKQVLRMAAALKARGIGRGDVVSVIARNRPEMLAAHYAVPMIGAVLNTINIRLDRGTIEYILDHGESRLLIVDPVCSEAALKAARAVGTPVLMLPDAADDAASDALDIFRGDLPDEIPGLLAEMTEEWRPICLNYTSGTTGNPKGVIYHHRGAHLNALGNAATLGLDEHSAYLWTLPMFHCNGWCHTWAVTAAGGLHVCLDRPDPDLILKELSRRDVTHFCCAPVVLYMLVNEPGVEALDMRTRVKVGTGGAAPTATLIEALGNLGFDLMHLYGLTESYGPATVCRLPEVSAEWDAARKARRLARQGVRHVTGSDVRVLREDGSDVTPDGTEMGEIALTGNTLMAGYYRDRDATETALRGGCFHTGDLAVRFEDGSIQVKDRAKDIIISGGENISSLEVEEALHKHPAVLLAAVVAAPHPKWGETPFAFIELKEGEEVDGAALTAFCRAHLAGFKLPHRFHFGPLPKTATGKVRKFELRQAAAGLDQ
ncbi:MAG: AMP-binding protein [Paracoccaceae bacterium]